MSPANLVRLIGFVVPAIAAVGVLWATNSLLWFALACLAALGLGIPVERAYRRLASAEEQRRDLEDRVRNPPS